MMTTAIIIVPQPPTGGRALGEKIKSLDELHAAVMQKRSVISLENFKNYQPSTPAAWIWMQSASHVFNLINWGLYIYHPPVKTNRWKKSK
jgi:hypothetical protein